MIVIVLGLHLLAAVSAFLVEFSNWMNQAITYEMVLIARYADL